MPTITKYATTKAYGDCTGPLGFPMLSDAAKEIEGLLKDVPAELRSRIKTEINGETVEGYGRAFKAPSSIDLVEGERSDISLVTTASVDRDAEVMLPKGGDWRQFLKNPVVTFAHDYFSLPAGRALWVKRQKNDDDPRLDGVLAKTRYTPKPEEWAGDWFPDAVWHMIKTGDLRGKSIGFIPLDWKHPEEDDIRKRPDLAGVDTVITKWLVLEYAVAPIPSNPDAIVTAVAKCRQKGLAVPADVLERMGIMVPEDTPSLEELLKQAPPKSEMKRTEPPKRQILTGSKIRELIGGAFAGCDLAAMMKDEMDRIRGRV